MTSVQLAVHTKKVARLWRLLADVQGPSFVDNVLFARRHSLLLQQVFGPRRNDDLYSVGVWATEVFMQAPAECPIPQMDQANFSYSLEELLPVCPIDFKIDVD